MTGKEIREKFLKYFSDRGHEVVKSSSLVPHNDPTLLFTNAGMNQFKDLFLGLEDRGYNKAVSAQKVVRAGGKHNDLENVGRTARHHTFFEMLGNFSFGDYFKEDAISYGWDFLTNVIGLPKEKLFVSIYYDDEDAFEIWNKVIGLPQEKILRKGEKDNFWSMGDTGPCGPCSEIHIDQGEGVGCCRPDCSPDCDCDRHLELWNLVFMQFDRNKAGELIPLPKPSIDTGMGLERISAVSQKVTSNYDTDLLKPIIEFTASIAGIEYGDDDKKDVSLRVIADHSRSTTFLISDGVIPSNEGRGYVLRRIMRRAMRHGRMLGFKEEFFYKVCSFVVDFMGDHYIELLDKKAYVSSSVKFEEQRFGRTLDSGLKIINELFEKYSSERNLSGREIFKLYDTYGFPVDLLGDIAEDNNFLLDIEGFNSEMLLQQERAKKSWAGSGEEKVSEIYIKLISELKTEFVGYDSNSSDAIVNCIILNGKKVEEAFEGDSVEIVLDKSVFYPEGGGQVGDAGVMKSDSATISVLNTKKIGNSLIIHSCNVIKGSIKVNSQVKCEIDVECREKVEKNHTATHIMHKALQMVLGDHVRQAGSFVTNERLRFDFNHFMPMTDDDITKVEKIVNNIIQKNYEVSKNYKPIDEAIKSGAMALFGEKYGDVVRVVNVGDFSCELCGGCHVSTSGEIGLFKIISESSVAAGVRRIEACTSGTAFDLLSSSYNVISAITKQLKTSTDEIANKIEEIQTENKEMIKEISYLNDKILASKSEEYLKNIKNIKGINVLSVRVDEVSLDSLRNLIDLLKGKIKSGIVVIGSSNKEKVFFLAGVTKDLIPGVSAGKIVKELATFAGGSGGGRDDFAQAGAKDSSKIDAALEMVYNLI